MSGNLARRTLDNGGRGLISKGRETLAMSSARAMRYRKTGLAEQDNGKADLLLKLADECDRRLLCTAVWLSARPYRKTEQPPQVGDVRAGLGGIRSTTALETRSGCSGFGTTSA